MYTITHQIPLPKEKFLLILLGPLPNVILFLKNSFELTELENCVGKVIGTNLPQGGSVSTGDNLIFIIGSKNED